MDGANSQSTLPSGLARNRTVEWKWDEVGPSCGDRSRRTTLTVCVGGRVTAGELWRGLGGSSCDDPGQER